MAPSPDSDICRLPRAALAPLFLKQFFSRRPFQKYEAGFVSKIAVNGGRSLPRGPPHSCHKPDAIGHDQKPVGEAHPRGQRPLHLASETDDNKRSKKQPQTTPSQKCRPSQPVGQQKLRFAAGEASVDEGERNRRADNDDKRRYAVQVADYGCLDWRKDTADKKAAPITSSPHQPMRPPRVCKQGPSERATRSALAPRRQKASDIMNP